jgi:hypothetical protein
MREQVCPSVALYSARLSAARRGVRPSAARRGVRRPLVARHLTIHIDIDKPYLAVLYVLYPHTVYVPGTGPRYACVQQYK